MGSAGGEVRAGGTPITIAELKALIERSGDEYRTALLEHAAAFAGRSPTDDVPAVRDWLERYPAQPGQCYRNAQFLCLSGSHEVQYHEGYWSYRPELAVHHAWAVLDGRVIDTTAEAADRLLEGHGLAPDDPAADAYVGIHVPTPFIRERLARTGAWLPVAAEYMTNCGTPVRHPDGHTLVA